MDRTLLKLRLADLFCGAGGTSTGACEAVTAAGFEPVLTAINHWPTAIATHTANHREATHLCASVDDVDPRKLYRLGELDLLWASPECTHHSRARGGKPMHDQSRATGHCVVRWAEALQPPVILVENVPEFVDWGPLGADGKPLKSKKGATFKAWVAMLEALGYKVEWRILCAADYGDPTTRKRLFIQCVRGRRKITWPHRTHAPVAELADLATNPDLFSINSQLPTHPLRPWRAARECIDWNHKGRWLDEMPGKKQYGGLPLSPKTLRRIHAGLRKYGFRPHLIPAQTGADRTRSVDRPLQTVTTESRGIGLVEPAPYIVEWDHTGGNGAGIKSADDPLSTACTKARHGVVEPFVVELRGTAADQIPASAKSVDAPLGAVTAGGGHHAVVDPYLVQVAHGDSGGTRTRSVDEPLNTVCGERGDMALIEPALLGQHSCSALRPVSEPSPTVTCDGAIALVEPFILPPEGVHRGNRARSTDEPLATVTAQRGAGHIVEPHLVKFYGTATAADIADPLDTVTTKERFGLVEAQLLEALPHLAGRSAELIDQILPAVELGGTGPSGGRRYRVRLRWRMLQPVELSQAQGFPKEYRFTGTKTDAVKQIGNAVPRHLAWALVFAALTQNPDVSALWN